MGREQRSFNGFKFGTLIGRFPSDSVASMAVKGLRRPVQKQTVQITPFKVQVLLALHSASFVAKMAKNGPCNVRIRIQIQINTSVFASFDGSSSIGTTKEQPQGCSSEGGKQK